MKHRTPILGTLKPVDYADSSMRAPRKDNDQLTYQKLISNQYLNSTGNSHRTKDKLTLMKISDNPIDLLGPTS
jgi:hypothetical protein